MGGAEAWQRFTPAKINDELCLARTWNGGAGGQCKFRPVSGQEFCRHHASNDKWKVHGRLDGPIPEKKLREFERNKPVRFAPQAEEPSPKKIRVEHRKVDALPPSAPEVHSAFGDTLKPEVKKDAKPMKAEAKNWAQPKAERSSEQVPPERPARARRSAHELFRPVAREVAQIQAQILTLPKSERKAAWKKQLRQYHPDKVHVASRKLSPEQMKEAFLEIKRRYDDANKDSQRTHRFKSVPVKEYDLRRRR
eukprot:TRINITY_DN44455_c0_g1_i1.p1 TRINITY_DN44455_c0_g1~~TRINITY_DN44455_c0_g1_i1.p1  ORF type:complete len:251 (+),score=52.54 TRINITY_DN44455_c0_g1_i1:76-828(+)